MSFKTVLLIGCLLGVSPVVGAVQAEPAQTSSGLAGAEQFDNTTIVMKGDFPTDQARTYYLSSHFELHGQRLSYQSDVEHGLEMPLDGSAVTSTAVVLCSENLKPSEPHRTWISNAFFAADTGGTLTRLIVNRHSRHVFAAGGACDGIYWDIVEQYSISLANKGCEFSYFRAEHRNGLMDRELVLSVVKQPCQATFAQPSADATTANAAPKAETASVQQATPLKLIVACNYRGVADALNSSLKHIDDEVTEVLINNFQLDMAHNRYVVACQALKGNFNQSGPKMDEYKTRMYEMGIFKGRVSDLYDALRTKAEADLFASTGAAMTRQFGSPDCQNAIKATTTVLSQQAQTLLKTAQVYCESK